MFWCNTDKINLSENEVSHRPVHLVLQVLVDPLKSCIAALDPERTVRNYRRSKNVNRYIHIS